MCLPALLGPFRSADSDLDIWIVFLSHHLLTLECAQAHDVRRHHRLRLRHHVSRQAEIQLLQVFISHVHVREAKVVLGFLLLLVLIAEVRVVIWLLGRSSLHFLTF